MKGPIRDADRQTIEDDDDDEAHLFTEESRERERNVNVSRYYDPDELIDI